MEHSTCLLLHWYTDVYKQWYFTYTGKEEYLSLEEYGVRLYFPSSPTEVHREVRVTLLSRDYNNYVFPEGSELVSAVYDISANKPFPQPVTLQLQHCLTIEREEESSAMSFVVATTEEGPPYKFDVLSGGTFRCGSSYGEIECAHFSMRAVIRWCKWQLGRPMPFCASVHYFQNGRTKFVVIQNLEAHISVSIL